MFFTVQFAGSTVEHKYYELLYNHIKDRGLQLAPKITYAHIFPTIWQRMTVSLATQLFSKHTAMALLFLRNNTETEPLFKGNCCIQ